MCTKRFYKLIPVINARLRLTQCYEVQTNYSLLFLLAKSYEINLAPSRSALLVHNRIALPLVRELTNKALDRFMSSGSNQRLIIDTRLLVSEPSLGQYNLDCCSDFDRQISLHAKLLGRYT